MRGIIERARALISGKTPAEQLAEVRAKLAEARAETTRLDEEIGRRALPRLRGDVEAARVAADLEREKQTIVDELATMRTAEGQLAAAVAAEERAAAHAAASALPRRVAEQAAAVLDADDEIDYLAAGLAEAIRARKAAGLALADLAGSAQLRQINSGTSGRIRDSIARYFQDPTDSRRDGNDLLLASALRGAAGQMTLRQRDRELLDDECPYFTSQEAADEAAARLAERNTKTSVHRLPDGCCTLIRTDDLYVDRGSAETAVRLAAKVGFALTVTPYRGGFVVRPPRAADAILTTEAA